MAKQTLADNQPLGASLPSSFVTHVKGNHEAVVTISSGSLTAGKAPCFYGGAQAVEISDTVDLFNCILQKGEIPCKLKENCRRLERDHFFEAGLGADAASNPLSFAQSAGALAATSDAAGKREMSSSKTALNFAALKDGAKDGRYASADTVATPMEYEMGRSNTSILPKGVCAVGEGPLVEEDSFVFNEHDMYAIARACQSTSEMAASDLTANKDSWKDAKNIYNTCNVLPLSSKPAGPLASPRALETQVTKGPSAELSGDAKVDDGFTGALQWPFESGLRPWEDVGQDARKTAEGASCSHLEDSKKKRIWVVYGVRFQTVINRKTPAFRLCKSVLEAPYTINMLTSLNACNITHMFKGVQHIVKTTSCAFKKSGLEHCVGAKYHSNSLALTLLRFVDLAFIFLLRGILWYSRVFLRRSHGIWTRALKT